MKRLVWEEYENLLKTTDRVILEDICRYKHRVARILTKKLGISSPSKTDTIVKYIEEYHEKNKSLPPWRNKSSKR
ncbi:hypothetical protein CMI37_22940 [Candidatus Pacearchaeota archaeon]|nr:hypothetical protein [Candidatus Pacearchaeota archaeon]